MVRGSRGSATYDRQGQGRRQPGHTARNARRGRGPRRSALPIKPILALLAAALTLVATRLAFCGNGSPVDIIEQAIQPKGLSLAVTDAEALYVSPFNWGHLANQNGRYAYVSGTEVLSRLGIDVSEHNGSIDWKRVKASGVDFAYVRIGYRGSMAGNIVEDANFATNFKGAGDAGLDLGVYFFSQATTEEEAREEANFVTHTLKGADLTYPVAFDMEPAEDGSDRVSKLNNSQLTAVARAFCEQCQANGYNAVVYGNQYDLAHYDLTQLLPYGFWYAEYASQPTMDLRFGIWQYTKSGSIDGIEGKVDIDLDLSQVLAASNGTNSQG